MDDNSDVKKSKGTKKGVIKRELLFENYKDCFFNDKIILKSQQRYKSDHYNVYTEEINKIALNSNDDKRLQTSDRIKTYPYGTNAFKVCESEMLMVKRFIFCNIKMINFDNYANENKTKHIIIGHIFQIIYTEY